MLPPTRSPRRHAVLAGALLLAATSAMLTMPATPAVAAQEGPAWSVAPAAAPDGSPRANFDYAVDPGEVIHDALTVANTGLVPLTLAVYAADAFTTRSGDLDLLADGTKSTDSGTWVAIGTPTLRLDPGQSSAIPFTVTVPVGARPGDHPTGIVASLTTSGDGTVQVDRRLGSRMNIRVSGAVHPGVRVSDLTVGFDGVWNPLAVGTVDIAYTVRNTGNVRVAARSELVVAGPAGIGSTSASEQLPEVLPGSTIEVHRRVTGVAALLALVAGVEVHPESVGIGATPLATVHREGVVAAVPAATLLILLMLAASVVAAVIVRRRRRAARKQPSVE